MATFLIHTDQLPELAKLIAQNISGLNNSIAQDTLSNSGQTSARDIMSVDDLREFLPNKPSRSAIYGLTHRKRIPFHKPTGRHIYFVREEIERWIFENKSYLPEKFTTNPKKVNEKSFRHEHSNKKFTK